MKTQQTETDSIRVERLAHLCKLWGVVKFFHPYLAYRDMDWDGALVATIPMVNTAVTSKEYGTALQSMLDTLGDPATCIISHSTASSSNDFKPLTSEFTEDGILIVTIAHGKLMDYLSTWPEKLRAIGDEMPKACGVLFDLRVVGPLPPEAPTWLAYLFTASGLNSKLSTERLYSPSQRTRQHVGFAAHKGSSYGFYYSAFQICDGERFSPSSGAQDKRVVFLVNEPSALPPVALALQSAGKAAIVIEEKASDASLVKTHTVSLGEELNAQVRLSELVYQDGPSGLHPDMVVSISPRDNKDQEDQEDREDQEDQALQAALALLHNLKSPSLPRTPLPARGVPQTEQMYSQMSYPALEYRLLAAFRIWNIVNYFFPYKELMEEPWEAVLKPFIVKMEIASNALEYTLTVAEMVKHLNDSHAFISSSVLRDYFGAASPPVMARMIEGVPVITRFRDETVAREAGLEIGDVLLKIDGEDVSRRIERYCKYIAASTPQALMKSVMSRFMNGAEHSVATLTVRDRMQQIKEINVPRSGAYWQNWNGWRSRDIFKILPGNIGYADLDRLTGEMVDQMFEMFKETKAIIFDMRGYPNGTVWAIASRLTSKSGVIGAMFQRPLVLRPEGWSNHIMSQPSTDIYLQPIPRTENSGDHYQGQTVMLIDERTVSQAEHTGLFFRAANGTKFIGSHTTGANGDVTNFYVPGEILIYFTGQAVKHADGRQLQRIGLVPDIEVKPSISGIRAGKDEVLEKALEFLGTRIN